MKSKRIILNIAILLLTIVFASSISVFVSAQTADTNTPTIFIGDSTVVAGKTIEVDILLLDSPGVASVIIDVTFDEELLTLKSINFGEEFESGSDLPQTFASPIRLSWADLDNMVGDLSFATLTFEAKKNISKDCLTEICVEYASSNIINLEEEPVFFDVHNGKLTVNIGYPGDINGDGEVNAKDLLRLRKYFAGWDVQVDETAVDVNGDGEVNAKDLLRLRKYFAGWEVEIFYGTKSNLKCAHLMEKTSATPATCTETGNSEYWYCSVCDKYFSDAEGETEITLASTVIPATGHTPGEAVIENRVEPTCTVKGSYDEVVYCTTCGDELSRTHKEIAALGHTMTATAAKDATCTEAGNTAYWYCSECGKYFSDAEGETEITLASTVIPAKGHTPGEAVIENRVEPTCTEKGSYDEVVYCTVCGDELSRTHKEVAALGHTLTATAAKDATCTEAGNTAYWHCSVCDKYFSDAEGENEIAVNSWIIPATGHAPGEAVIENRVEPTCTEKGSYDEVVYCTVCGEELSRTHKEIAALGHTMTATAAKDATCTEAGNTAYWYCSECGKYFSDAEGKTEITLASTVIPATGHSFSKAWTYDDEYHWHVSTCGHDVVSDKTEHTFENGFCTVCKLGQKIVENGIKYQYGKENKETVLTVIAYEGNASEVVVPATVNGVRVSVINAHVFEGEQFTKITIPASLDYLGWNAIYGCPNLTEIAVVDEGYYFAENNMIMYKDGPRVDEGEVRLCYVPDGITGEVIIPGIVTEIGADSFDNCVGVTSVHIPSSVKISCEFGVYGSNDSAFSNCPNLTTIYGYAGTCAETVASNNNIDFVAYSEGLAYTSNGDGTCAVTGIGDCTDTDIVIPHISLDGNTVTGIGDYAFQNCNGITSVTMPSSVTNIGWYALSFCNKLTEINVDENNTNYSSVNGVLYNKAQTMLICYPEGKTETSFTILASVTSIKDGAFSGCSYLTAITADENNEYYSSVNGVLYNKNQTMIVCVPSGVSGDFVIPSNVSVIGNNAFAWCTKITNVTIPEGVTTISSNAFSGCSSLKSITIPDGVTSIGSYAFNQCSKLSRIILPASLKNISIGAFQMCSQLDSVYYLGTDEQWAEITIGSNNDPLINAGYARTYTYNGFIYANITVSDTPSCIILGYVGDESEVVVPETINDVWVSRIVEGTFKGEQFTKITIPAGLDYLGWNAIYGCPNLTEIAVSGEGCYFVVDNMLLYKGPRVDDDGVRLVYIPDGTTGDVIVPDVVTDIGPDSFDNCVGVTSVYIPSSVTFSFEFGVPGSYDSAFTNCTNLTTIYGYAGSCAETIASNNNIEFVNLFVTPYFYCNETDDGNLTIKKYYGKVSNVVIPETINGKTVVGIEKNSFYWVNLQSLYIPKTIKYIDEMAFRGLNLLSSVSVSDESTSFVVINGLLYTKDKTALVLTTCAVSGDVVVPEGVNTLYGSCFQSRTGITSITLPSTLKEINTFSFRDMRITSIVIPNGVEEIDEYAFFQSINLSEVIIPESVTTIGDGAFEECTSLTSIVIPDSVTEISETAFKNSALTTIYGYAGSYAETYANENGYTFVAIPKYSKGLAYTSNGDGTCYVSGIGTCTDTEIIIPPTSPAGDTVTSIGNYAFYNCSGLTSIEIPSSVTSIGSSAFSGCTGLTSIEIPSSVTSIGSSAFSGCTGLTSIEIPSSVTSIGDNAFGGCSGLNAVYVEDIESWCKINFKTSSYNPLFYAHNLYLNGELVTELIIPDTVTSIGDYAFEGCSGLTSITIPSSVTSIGKYAFNGCNNLTSITIPFVGGRADGTGSTAFSYIFGNIPTSLKSVVITGGYIYAYSFRNSTNITNLTIDDGVTGVGNEAFSNCTGLISVTISESVERIGTGAFKGCTGLNNLTIPFVGEKSDGSGATDFCYIFGGDSYVLPSSLKNVVITGGTNIDNNAFSYCSNLENVLLPSSITSIGKNAFVGCGKLTGIIIPASVTSIGENAFDQCAGLESISVEEGNGVYHSEGNCLIRTALKELILGCKNSVIPTDESVISIGDYAFSYCINLESITIPSNIVRIGIDSFRACTGLNTVTIPSSVNYIGNGAFRYCKLTSITVPFVGEKADGFGNRYFGNIFGRGNYTNYNENVPSSLKSVVITGGNIETSSFTRCTNITEVMIAGGVTSVGDGAFSDCTGLINVTISEGVGRIGRGVFRNCTSLESITIPYVGERADGSGYTNFSSTFDPVPSSLKTVVITGGERIGNLAFSGCSNLENIEIPSSVTNIGDYAFQNCSSLTSIEIPSSVTSIGRGPFNGCSELISIIVDDGNQTYCSEDNCLIEITSKTLVAGCKNSVIPTGGRVTKIGTYAFYGCSELTSVTIPSTITSIETLAFGECSGLASIIVEDGNKTYYSDGNCLIEIASKTLITGCKSSVIPDDGSVTSIGKYAFYGCSSLTSIEIPSSVTSIGNEAFYGCTSLTSVTFSKNSQLESIGKYAFNGCSSLTSIEIPSSVTSIGNEAFRGCTSLTSVTFGENSQLESIDSGAFYNCSSLTSITIPPSVTSIGYDAFYGCTSLTSITIPSSVTSIGSSAFSGCSGLISIEIPSSVTSIGDNAFGGCSGLNAVYVEDIESWCKINFKTSSCNPLFYAHNLYLNGELVTELIIPDTVTSIGSYAFYGCNGLTSIEIPSSVTSIGGGAFYNCTSLTSIKIPSSVTSIGGSAFYGCTGLTSIKIPSSVTYIGESAFSGCSGLTSITIPSSVTSIGNYAFNNCSKLATVYYGGTEAQWAAINIGWYNSNLTNATISFVPCYYGHTMTATAANDASCTDAGNSAYWHCSVCDKYFSDAEGKNEIAENSWIVPATGHSFSDEWTYDDEHHWHTATCGHNVVSDKAEHTYDENKICTVCGKQKKDSEGIEFTSNGNGTCYVSGIGTCIDTDIVIPPTSPDGDSVTSIGDDAFRDCTILTSIEIPSSVTSIGECAFLYCTGLTSITIPSSVTSIGSGAFVYCSSLDSITVEEGNPVYHSSGNCLIDTATKTIVVGCKNSVIADDGSVTSIGDSAFDGCSGLTSITIPEGVTSIGESAFSRCRGLTSITIPSSVTSIGSSAFIGCTGLTSIEIPSSVKSIGDSAFWECMGLTSVTFGENSQLTSIGDGAFNGCSGLTSITIPEGVTSIGSNAFYGCTYLYKVTNKSNLKISIESSDNGYIANYAKILIDKDGTKTYRNDGYTYIETEDNFLFDLKNGQYRLIAYFGEEDTVTLPEIISGNAYTINRLCGVKNIIIPSNVTSISYSSFVLSNLESVIVEDGNTVYHSSGNCIINTATKTLVVGCNNSVIPDDGSVTSIGYGAFYGCTSLERITIPAGVTSIGNSAFCDCTSLTSIEIPSSVTSISSSAFYGCSGLTSVTFGENSQLLSIGGSAFSRCYRLASIEIPSSVTSIVNEAFYGCSSLTSVTFGENSQLLSIGDSAFNDCPGLTSITIPSSVKNIGSRAFSYCSSLTSIDIPSSVTNIGSRAFSGCSSLTTVYYTGTSEQWAAISIGSYNSNLTNATIIYNKQ